MLGLSQEEMTLVAVMPTNQVSLFHDAELCLRSRLQALESVGALVLFL